MNPPLPCGCFVVGNSRSYSLCRENHGPKVGNVLPKAPKPAKPTDAGPVASPRQEQQRRDARESGRKLKPGRHVLNQATGKTEKVEESER